MKRTKNPTSVSIFSLTVLCFIFSAGCQMMDPPAELLTDNSELAEDRGISNKPINNPISFMYSGRSSGLYSWGNALIDNTYETDYINANKEIKTLNTAGNSAVNGKIGILQIGGSNPGILFNGLKAVQQDDAGFGSKLTFVNAGLNAMDLSDILKPDTDYWNTVQSLLSANGISALQVEVIFCVEDNLKNSDKTFNRAVSLKNDFIDLLDLVRTKYPNCKVFLIGDRAYTGYATDIMHKEPVGYLNGWGVKLFVEEYSSGLLPKYPVVNWLDYYWANGETPRFDGLTYVRSDYRSGYIHFTDEKAYELSEGTHQKLKTDIGTSNWYK